MLSFAEIKPIRKGFPVSSFSEQPHRLRSQVACSGRRTRGLIYFGDGRDIAGGAEMGADSAARGGIVRL
jgi:hypothetical protein